MSIAPCSSAPAPVSGVVVFEPAVFIVTYPEFSAVSAAALQVNFGLATLILNNSCCSVVSDANVRETLLNVLTAHITALLNGVNGQPVSDLVGRINSATEGSVSVSAEYAAGLSQSQAWFIQTKYGALFWTLTAQYRTMRYIPPPNRCVGVGPYGGRSGI